MNRDTQRSSVAGPAGVIECAIDQPTGDFATVARGVVVVCHPHPQFGGTMDNKVVHTISRAFLQLGYRSVRFNFRGVGESAGSFDDGRGEIDDALTVIAAQRQPGLPLALAGFSFGGYVAASAAERLQLANTPVERLVLVGPSTERHVLPVVAADTVVVHGEADDVVPLSATLDWARPQVLPVVVLPGVGHFFHGQLTLLKQQIVQAWRR